MTPFVLHREEKEREKKCVCVYIYSMYLRGWPLTGFGDAGMAGWWLNKYRVSSQCTTIEANGMRLAAALFVHQGALMCILFVL